MAGKADVQTHLDKRRGCLGALFNGWSADGLTAEHRTAILERYFEENNLGEVRRIGGGQSLQVVAPVVGPNRTNVLIVGRHDVTDLSPNAGRGRLATSFVGPGLASRIGPTIAFNEGLHAARAVTGEDPVSVSFVSVGEGDRFDELAATLFTGNIDAVFLTNAVGWSPRHPTITTGSRGQLVIQMTLDARSAISDFSVSGALRNPLTKMTQILGALRDSAGRIVLPGFYDRAHAPDASVRAALQSNGYDPNDWAHNIGVARPSGGLSSLERATLWPGVSVLAIETDTNDGLTAPASVTATVALYLVPDQRHSEIEHATREWFNQQAPDDLNPTIRVLTSTRPFRTPPESVPIAAQVRAAYRCYRRHPILVPAGGPPGAGEIAFATGAPVGFAGISPPSASLGTLAEDLAWSDVEAGTLMAAETCLQLGRP